jgi:hypothetical protein
MENAEEIAQAILRKGYQVIFDLRLYKDDGVRAQIMTTIIDGLMRYAESLPNADRIPCMVFVDEASYWFPQDKSMVSPAILPIVFKSQLRGACEMVNTGRKRGIIPVWFDQRPANLDKRLIAQSDIYIFMRQSQDVDIKRYEQVLGPDFAARATQLANGQAIVKIPDIPVFVTQFYERRSTHVSHTPTVAKAIERFGHRTREKPATMLSKRQHVYHPPTSAIPNTLMSKQYMEEAVAAWHNGDNSTRLLLSYMRNQHPQMDITHYQVYALCQELDKQGHIKLKKQQTAQKTAVLD